MIATPRRHTMRAQVLAALTAAHGPLTGRQLATATGLTYRQTIDALNALYNLGRAARAGRKFTARWAVPTATPPPNPFAPLEALWQPARRK